MDSKPLFLFPKWSNRATIVALLVALAAPLYLGILLVYGANPTTLHVGYSPVQPDPYSHALHAGKLGIDCRYCHTTVEKAAMAAVPQTEICMNCHLAIFADSPKLAAVRKSYAEGTPVLWIKVHDLPDYVYFNHAAHVNVGVGCAECHGPVHQMEQVRQVQPMHMGWCLECHRSPEKFLRPRDQVTHMDWTPASLGDEAAQKAVRQQLLEEYHVNASTDCITCHR